MSHVATERERAPQIDTIRGVAAVVFGRINQAIADSAIYKWIDIKERSNRARLLKKWGEELNRKR